MKIILATKKIYWPVDSFDFHNFFHTHVLLIPTMMNFLHLSLTHDHQQFQSALEEKKADYYSSCFFFFPNISFCLKFNAYIDFEKKVI